MERIIEWFAKNKVAPNLLFLLFIIGGIVSLTHMRMEIFPDVEPDIITIKVSYPGASPYEVEEGIIKPIEEKISGLPGIKNIDSTAQEGLGIVKVEVLQGWDANRLLQDIKNNVDRITTFPEEAEKPIVQKVVRRFPVISIAVYGNVTEGVLKKIGLKLKEKLKELPDVTEVHLYAVRPYEIHIEVPVENLERYHLSLSTLANIIKARLKDIPSGKIVVDGRKEIIIRVKGKTTDPQVLGKIPVISGKNGNPIYLRDIARIKKEFRDDLFLAGYFEGQRAIIVQVFKVGNQNDLKISKEVRDFLKTFNSELPPGVKSAIYFDTTTILKSRLKLLLKNLLFGGILVVLILTLFMEFKLAFWVFLGIPTAFAFALWLMPHFNLSINMISLFGFILVLGIVVDDAIVIGESVYKRIEMGRPPVLASIEGTREVYLPVIFSVLTTIAAFYPLLLGHGVVGKVMMNVPAVVILVLIGSLIEALFILPSHLAHTSFKPQKSRKSFLLKLNFLNEFKQKIGNFLEKFAILALNYRYITISLFIGIFLFSLGLVIGGKVKSVFLPTVEGDQIDCYITMPAGTPAEKTLEVAQRIAEIGQKVIPHNVYKYTLTMLGVQMVTHGPRAGAKDIGENLAQVTIRLIPAEKRPDVSATSLAQKWRKAVGDIPGVESIVFQSKLFNPGADIQVNFYHEDEKVLLKVVKKFKKVLRNFKGVYNIDDNFKPGKEEIEISLKPSAKRMGLTLSQVAREVRAAFYGEKVLTFEKGEDEVRVLLRLPKKDRKSFYDLLNFKILTPSGKFVPLKEIAILKIKRNPDILLRHNLKRVITVSADVDKTVASAERIRRVLKTEILPEFEKRYPGLSFSMEGAARSQKEAFSDVKRAFILALFLIYALLAIPSNSFIKPLIIMSVIPFGIIGAFWGHILVGKPICILSIFGIVGTAGVVVNDSLLLLDAIENFKKQTRDYFSAIFIAIKRRFRPIMLTTVTTFFGLVPMISEKSVQAQFVIPMAISLAFGVAFATLITLIFVPCLFLAVEDIKNLFK